MREGEAWTRQRCRYSGEASDEALESCWRALRFASLFIVDAPTSQTRLLLLSLAVLGGPAPRGKEPGRRVEIDVGDENTVPAVRLVREKRSVGADDCRRRRRPLGRVVDAREPARVLRRAAQHRLLVEAVLGVGKRRWTVAAWLGPGEVRMEHELRAAPGCPSDG